MSIRKHSAMYYGAYISDQDIYDGVQSKELIDKLVNTKEFDTFDGDDGEEVDTSVIDNPIMLRNYPLLAITNAHNGVGLVYFLGYPMRTNKEEDEKRIVGKDIFNKVNKQLNDLFSKFKPYKPEGKYEIQEVVGWY